MDSYNVQLITYAHGQQMRKYQRPVNTGFKKPVPVLDFSPWGDVISKKYDCDKAIISDSVRCEKVSRNRTKMKVYEMARSDDWQYFVTFTFNPKLIDRTDYDKITIALHNWFKDIKKTIAPNLKYIVVPELHDDKKSFHFHGLLSNIGTLTLLESGHFTSFRTGHQTIYNLSNYYLGWSTLTKVRYPERVSGYITKYITKDLCAVTKGKKRYWNSRNLNKPDKKYYNLSSEQIDDIIDSISNKITHIKSDKIFIANQQIEYIEIADF